MKRPKTCLFCGTRAGISKEHFWPEWLAPHLAPPEANTHISEFHSAEGKYPPSLERRTERPGAVHTRKIRAVCASCNNGWMSALESKVRSILLPLLVRSQPPSSAEATHTLALWVAVKSIVGEHANEATALTPPEDRHAVRDRSVIPDYFRVFVAYHALRTQTAYYRHSTTMSRSKLGPDPALPKGIKRNIQATTFLVGPLCFYVVAARVANFSAATLDPDRPMLRLHPEPDSLERLSSLPALAQIDVYAVTRTLERLIEHPRVQYGGPHPRPLFGAT